MNLTPPGPLDVGLVQTCERIPLLGTAVYAVRTARLLLELFQADVSKTQTSADAVVLPFQVTTGPAPGTLK
jgi:hypothetical protein